MKHQFRSRRLSTFLLVLAVLCAALPLAGGTTFAARGQRAAAQQTLTFSANPATPGQQVTASFCNSAVSGSTLSATVTVTASNTNTIVSSTAVTLSSYSTNCYSFSLTAPTTGSPSYFVSVSYNGSTIADGTLNMTTGTSSCTTGLCFSPSTATPGQQVTASLCNVSTSATVTVSITAANTGTAAPGYPQTVTLSGPTNGCYTFLFTAPTTGSSSYFVSVASGATTIASGTLYVSSSGGTGLSFSPSTATPGQLVTAYLCNASVSGSTVIVTITASNTGATVTGYPTSVTLSGYSSGCYTFTFYAPSTGSPSYTVSVSNNGSTIASATLTMSTSTGTGLSLSPNPATAGQQVTGTLCNVSVTGGSVYVTIATSAGASVSGPTQTNVTQVSSTCYIFSFTAPTYGSPSYLVSVANTYSGSTIGSATLTIGNCTAGTTGCTTGTLTLTPSSGVSGGAQVTAYGCGYSASDTLTLTIYAYGTSTSLYSTTISSPVSSSGANGALCFTATFAVPSNLANGPYTVTLRGSSSGVANSNTLVVGPCTTGIASCTNTATLTATPATVAPGGTITLNGSGFSLGAVVTITGIGTSQTLATSSGTFTTSFMVPSSTTVGSYTITAQDTAGHTGSVSITVSTNATSSTLSPSATSGAPGQVITVTGSGFQAGEQVSLSLGTPVTGGSPSALQGTTQLFTVAGNGTYSASYTIPSVAPGSYDLLVLGQTSRVFSYVPFTVTSGTATGTITPSVTSAITGQTITVTGSGFRAGEQVSLSLGTPVPSGSPVALAGTSQVFTVGSNGSFSASYIVPSVPPSTYDLLALGQTSRVFAYVAITVTSATPTATPTPAVTPTLPAVGATATTSYYSDGYTGTASSNGKATFSERLYLYNAGSRASSVTTTYYVTNPSTQSHTTVTKQDSVAAGATVIRNVNQDVGDNRIVSIKVTASTGIVAEERIDRVSSTGATLDSDSSLGSPRLDSAWYFAEGYTGITFQEYLTLFNPSTSDAHALVQYLPGGTTTPPPAPQSVTVPAQSQVTINVRSQYNGLVAKGSRSIAVAVTSDVPIAVDRAMYWGAGGGSGKYGYSLAPGITAGAHSQYFSLLPTSGGSQSFITVLNPNSSATTVSLTLVNAAGHTLKTTSASVGPHARYTFAVPSLVSGDNGYLSGGLLSSGLPVVAEAAIYFSGSPNIGNHPGMVIQGSVGAQIGARADVDAHGAVLQVYNPNSTAERVRVTLAGSSVFDGMVAGNASQLITLPSRGSDGGVLVLASGAYSATLLNGGLSSPTVWGGGLD